VAKFPWQSIVKPLLLASKYQTQIFELMYIFDSFFPVGTLAVSRHVRRHTGQCAGTHDCGAYATQTPVAGELGGFHPAATLLLWEAGLQAWTMESAVGTQHLLMEGPCG